MAVSTSEIAREFGVLPASVSNWRARHADFPAAVGETSRGPLFDLEEVREWYATRDTLKPKGRARIARAGEGYVCEVEVPKGCPVTILVNGVEIELPAELFG